MTRYRCVDATAAFVEAAEEWREKMEEREENDG